jgi:glycosyltransferase involved in cell wall biosynthesis
MKIALMPSAYAPAIGGVEELTRQLGRHLIAAGHQVEVWTHRYPSDLPRVEVIEEVTVRRIALPLPAASTTGLLRFLPGAASAIHHLSDAVQAFKPDILHVQCFSANGVYAAAISKLTRIPLIVTLQGETVMDSDDIYEHSASLRLGLRIGLRQATAVSGCSAFVLEDAVRRFGLAAGRGVVVPNGVDVRGDEAAGAGLDLPFERFVLGLGRVEHKKGFDLLLDAFADVSGSHPGLGLVIGGRGAVLGDLRLRAERLGLSNRVVFPGPLDRGQVAWAMRSAEIFVMPSRVEPFGIVTLEALDSGCPVVVSSRGGAAEIVRNGVEGLVVDPFDRSALAASMNTLLNDPKLRERLAEAGHQRAERYAWGQIVLEYLKLYEKAAP